MGNCMPRGNENPSQVLKKKFIAEPQTTTDRSHPTAHCKDEPLFILMIPKVILECPHESL